MPTNRSRIAPASGIHPLARSNTIGIERPSTTIRIARRPSTTSRRHRPARAPDSRSGLACGDGTPVIEATVAPVDVAGGLGSALGGLRQTTTGCPVALAGGIAIGVEGSGAAVGVTGLSGAALGGCWDACASDSGARFTG